MRNRIQDQLMWIDLEDNETKKIMYPILDTKGKPTGSERIVLPAFDLYSKNIGHGNGDQRISTFAYEIRTSPENAITLKNILCKISMASSNELTFIPYGMDSLGTEHKRHHKIYDHQTKQILDRNCGGSNIRSTKGRRGKIL